MNQELEDFLSELATQPPTATGYYPHTAGSIDSAILECDADSLDKDSRVKNVERKYAGAGNLVQLWVVLK